MRSASRAGSTLSTWRFTRVSPAALSGPASVVSRMPFVVIETSWIPGTAAIRPTMSTTSRRSVGSPPVRRTLRKPTLAAARTTVSISAAESSASSGSNASPCVGMQ